MDVTVMKYRVQRKRLLQGLGLAYVLVLLSFYPWQWRAADFGRAVAEQAAEIAGRTMDGQTAKDAGEAVPGQAGEDAGEAAPGQAAKDAGEAAPGQAGEDAGGAAPGQAMEKPKVAITFDDGPNAKWTPILLDGLKERSVKATFFLIGVNIEKGDNAEIVRRMQEEGHLIGNHTYHHVEMTKVSDTAALNELAVTGELIQNITGEPVEYMRPPFGAWQKELEERLHVIPVLWTVDTLDWKTENVDKIVDGVVKDIEENDIILLHDCYESSVEAALQIIDRLTEQGYEFVTVDELLAD